MIDKCNQASRRLIRKQIYYGLALFVMLVVFVLGYMLGGVANDWEASAMLFDITRTGIANLAGTTEALIEATQTQSPYETAIANIQPTQTYIADTWATLEAIIQSALDN